MTLTLKVGKHLKNNHGFTLMEVMVSLMVIAIVLLLSLTTIHRGLTLLDTCRWELTTVLTAETIVNNHSFGEGPEKESVVEEVTMPEGFILLRYEQKTPGRVLRLWACKPNFLLENADSLSSAAAVLP